MNLSTGQKQTPGHGEQTCVCQGGGGEEEGGNESWGQQMQIITFEMDNNKVLLYGTGNYPISWARP